MAQSDENRQVDQELCEKVALPPLAHIGVVVKDVDKAVGFYSSMLGIGPFIITEVDLEPDVNLYGQGPPVRLKVATACMNKIDLELIQVLQGETIHSEFLRTKGEGLHHLGFQVSDLDRLVSLMAEKGFKTVLSQKPPLVLSGTTINVGFAYLESTDVGYIIELVQFYS